MLFHRPWLSFLLLFSSGFFTAQAQEGCIEDFLSSRASTSNSEIVPADIKIIITKEANAIGLDSDSQSITIVPCLGERNVEAYYVGEEKKGPHLPQGEYMVYNPNWLRQIIGPNLNGASKRDDDQAGFIFAHELGHLIGRHFTTHRNIPKIDQERRADKFAGCAAGLLGADWSNVRELIERLRDDKDPAYPPRTESLKIVKEEFDACRARSEPSTTVPASMYSDQRLSSCDNKSGSSTGWELTIHAPTSAPRFEYTLKEFDQHLSAAWPASRVAKSDGSARAMMDKLLGAVRAQIPPEKPASSGGIQIPLKSRNDLMITRIRSTPSIVRVNYTDNFTDGSFRDEVRDIYVSGLSGEARSTVDQLDVQAEFSANEACKVAQKTLVGFSR